MLSIKHLFEPKEQTPLLKIGCHLLSSQFLTMPWQSRLVVVCIQKEVWIIYYFKILANEVEIVNMTSLILTMVWHGPKQSFHTKEYLFSHNLQCMKHND